jgi:hypothetical protein
MIIIHAAPSLSVQAVSLEQLQECKALLIWTPEDIIAFKKTADIKKGTLTFGSSIYLDQPPKNKDAAKAAKDLEKFNEKYAKKGAAPFNIMVDLELIQIKDKKKVKYSKDKTDIYIINYTDKKVTLKQKVPNGKFVPC